MSSVEVERTVSDIESSAHRDAGLGPDPTTHGDKLPVVVPADVDEVGAPYAVRVEELVRAVGVSGGRVQQGVRRVEAEARSEAGAWWRGSGFEFVGHGHEGAVRVVGAEDVERGKGCGLPHGVKRKEGAPSS